MDKKDKQKHSCNICTKNIRANAKAVCCDYCDNWVHIKCNSITPIRYAELCEEENNEPFLCLKCFNDEMPFGFESDKIFSQTVSLGLNSPNLDDLNFSITKTEKKLIKFLNKTISKKQ